MTEEKIIRIGGASGFWGDSAVAAPQLVASDEVDYLVFDYLAELTMAILSKARAKDPTLGYAVDFVSVALRQVLKDAVQKNIRLISNAGGMNPAACASAVEALADDLGVTLRVAVVEGDDILADLPKFAAGGQVKTDHGGPVRDDYASANVYLGAEPIKAALDAGADIVITGRCADSALVLGALMHEFGWTSRDYDKLAAGSLAGHILECGAQATGGLHTDWDKVPNWEAIGYPIASCRADGQFAVSKPRGTGGLVTPAVVAEQMLYEIGDPGAYILPDVICDFTAVTVRAKGPDRVEVSGARGYAPTQTCKVSATFIEGFRAIGTLTIIGRDAAAKAERTAEAILARVRAIFKKGNIQDFTHVDIEAIGAEAIYGPRSRARDTREVMLKLAVRHPDRRALEIFASEIAPAGTSFAPGTTGITAGRPKPQPVVRLESLFMDKQSLSPAVLIDGAAVSVPIDPPTRATERPDAPAPVAAAPALKEEGVRAPLIRLAYARSGDKGNSANIGVIARRPEYLPHIRRAVTEQSVARYFSHLVEGPVERFDVPGIAAVNFVLHRALQGGGMTSLRSDPLGKGLAQMLLDMEVEVPADLLG